MRYWLAFVTLKIPVVGELVLLKELVRFSQTLGSLLSGGVPLEKSLNLVSKCSGSECIAKDIWKFGREVSQGKNLSSVLKKSFLGKSVMVMMVEIGEENGQLDDALIRASRVYESEMTEKVKTLSTILEPILILGVGLAVGFLVFSVMLPIIDIEML